MRRRPTRRVVRFVLCLGLAALFTGGDAHAQPVDALPYSNGFLVTGNYVVGGVDLLKSGIPGTINFDAAHANTVPADADIVAAYLYWETITSSTNPVSGATFRGTAIQSAKASTLTSLPGNGASCWGSAGGSASKLGMFRADVLPLLPKRLDVNGQWTGKYLVNDADLSSNGLQPHTVTLPQEGTGNVLTQSAGATLLLVYRKPDEPLRKIVVYDGAYAQAQGTTMTQTIRGFYQSSSVKSARMTQIVGSGSGNTGERLLFNGSVVTTDPFPAPIDGNADRGWANPTFDLSPNMPGIPDAVYGETVTTAVDHGVDNTATTPYECLSWAAIIFSTSVADVDGDGIPDGVEDSSTGLKDPPTLADAGGQPLPNLNQMGASSAQKDLFVEINAMWAAAGTIYGSMNAPISTTAVSVTDVNGHTHLPTPEVLNMLGDVYAANGIRPHFDVGSITAYHALPGYACAVEDTQCDRYLVPSGLARGGETLQERACADGTVKCQFPDYPGTVGWRLGLQLYQDAPVADNGQELTNAEIIASWGAGTRRRRFDRSRSDYFHYVLYAHTRGKAKSPLPCLDVEGLPTGYDQPSSSCTTNNPQFHVPSSASGVADLPGQAVLVTLGLWDNFLGTPFVQASTTLHELGHNLNLWHGGAPAVFGNQTTATVVEPNCKPNYLSSMSYLFQAHGLFDDLGERHLNYSGAALSSIAEPSVSDGSLFPAPTYQPAWFAPATSAYAVAFGGSPATRFCNGTKFDPAAPPASMTRVRALSAAAAIDWNGDGFLNAAGPQDVNFDGSPSDTLSGHNDWANLRLDQIGAGRQVRVFSGASGDVIDFGSGDVIDFGSGDVVDFGSGDVMDFGSGTYLVHFQAGDVIDFGSGDVVDFGSGDVIDFGSGVGLSAGDTTDFGSGDVIDFGSGDVIDFGSGDVVDFGSGDVIDFGSGDVIDFGSGDVIDFGSGRGLQELDFETAKAIGRSAPSGLKACIIGQDCPLPDPNDPQLANYGQFGLWYHRVQLRWKTPTIDQPVDYRVLRASGNTITDLGTTSVPAFVDAEELPDGVQFTYFVKAEFADAPLVSGASNAVTITAVNTSPAASADAYTTPQGTTLTVAAAGVLGNDTDVDSPSAFVARSGSIVSGPSSGVLTFNANGSFAYVPNSSFSGTDSFTYKSNDGMWSATATPLSGDSNVATVTITVTPVTPPPASNRAPVCSSLEATVKTGGSVTLNAACSDPDGDSLTVTAVSSASLGTVTLNANGSFTYSVASPKVGSDTFTYTVRDGQASATGTVTMHVIYGFVNVQNLPPAAGKTFSRGGTAVLKWQWTNAAGTPFDSSLGDPEVLVSVLSTQGPLPSGWNGDFTLQNPGNGDSFALPTAKNSYTWQFNWKLTYTGTDGKLYELPQGTYLVRLKSRRTGQEDPKITNSNGTIGAQIVIK